MDSFPHNINAGQVLSSHFFRLTRRLQPRESFSEGGATGLSFATHQYFFAFLGQNQ
jgi:hypothetical protein